MKLPKKLTAAVVDDARPATGPYRVWDTVMPGWLCGKTKVACKVAVFSD